MLQVLFEYTSQQMYDGLATYAFDNIVVQILYVALVRLVSLLSCKTASCTRVQLTLCLVYNS